ncbi:MAG: hypothetical protein E7404_05835 [Ruminococcaceae bacterium]|nr:hypothetical protein [Oscillospiraceae bacterium]
MKTKDLIRISLFCALISIFSQISIPVLMVPLTLQTFIIALQGYILGMKNSLKTMLVYVLLGILGIPVFANFKCGISALLSPTGGYILAFFLVCIFCSLNTKHKILYGILGVFLLNVFGIIYFSLVSKVFDIATLFSMAGVFIIKDIISVTGAYLISKPIKKALNLTV